MKFLTHTNRLVVVTILTLAALLTACGDNTVTPAVATTAPAVATTAPAAAATTAPAAATTVAATTAATATTAAAASTTDAAAMTTAAAAAGGTACATCPASYTKITLPDGMLTAAMKGMPSTITDFSLEAYTTDDAADKVAIDTDASILARGYVFALPGATKPTKVGSFYAGAYTKAGMPDVLIQVVDTANLAEFLKTTGADDASQKTFTAAVGSKKTLLFLFGGTGVMSASSSGSATTTTPPPTTSGAGKGATN